MKKHLLTDERVRQEWSDERKHIHPYSQLEYEYVLIKTGAKAQLTHLAESEELRERIARKLIRIVKLMCGGVGMVGNGNILK